MAAPPFERTRSRLWLALLLGVACSSSHGPARVDAAAADAARPAPDAAAPDARGGSTGTSRGGSNGRRATGGTGGMVGTGGRGGGSTGGSGPSPDAAAPIDVQPPALVPHDTCETAKPVVLDRPHLDLTISTRGAGHHRDLPCAKGGADVFFSFTLGERELVYADSFGTSFDTILAFSDGCDAASAPGGAEPSCQDDACGTKQSQAVALLGPGPHFLVVSGAEGASGDVTIHLEHAPAGAGVVAALGPGTATASGTTSGTGRLALCEAGGPEDGYWWTTCPGFAGGLFLASTCSNTLYDSMLSLQIPRTGAVVCNDDACKLQAAITTNLPPGPGLHVLGVDGFTPRHHGAYTLSTKRP